MLSKRCRYVPGALLALALLPACADLAPPEDLPTDRAAASDDTVEISRAVTTPDVVLDLAESAAGWSATSGNTISVSTTRQQGAGSLSSVGAGVDRFRRTNLGPVDVRNMHYLTFWYFIDDASKILTDRDAQVEISSATAVDTEEMNWNLHGQRLVSGWNFVSLPLPGKLRSASGVAINLAAIRRFRIYHFVSASVTTRIDDIRFTTRADVAVEPSCASAAASATIQNVGETRSTASYGSSTCNKAYVVEVRAYAPTNTTGTVVAYSGPNTTDAAVCASTRVSAYVFRKHPTTGVFEAIPDRRGSFGTSAAGRVVDAGLSTQICQRPHVVLDIEYPNFLPGADYRVVVRSDRVVNGAREFRETTLVTPQPPNTASSDAARVRSLLASDAAVTALVQKARASSADSRGTACRIAQLEVVLLDKGAPALTGLGVSSSTATGYVAAVRAVIDALCDSTFGSSTFDAEYRTAIRNLASRTNDILNQVGTRLGVDQEMAGTLVEALLQDVFTQMMQECAPYQSTLAAFVFGGQSPGSPLSQALESSVFVACNPSGAASSASAKAQQIAQALASGQGTGFRACMNEVIRKEFSNKCTDPRADIETPLPSDVIDKCMQLKTPAEQDKCITDAQEQKRQRDAQEQKDEDDGEDEQPPTGYKSCEGLQGIELSICDGAQRALDSAAVPSAKDIQGTRSVTDVTGKPTFWTVVWFGAKQLAQEFFPKIAPAPIVIPLIGGSAALEGISKIQESELRRLCDVLPGHEKCQGLQQLGGNKQRCVGETFGDRSISYPTDDGPPGAQRATTVFDSIDHCWCQYIGTPIFGADCMSQEERTRQDCLRNPWGPDDAPRAECRRYLTDMSGVDQSALTAEMCKYIQPNCTGTAFIDIDGDCGCWRVNVDPDPAQLCRRGSTINCGPDSVFDQRSCGCQPMGSGQNPWGGEPLCGYDPRFSPGGRDGFITRTPNDLLTNRFYNFQGVPAIDFHMVRAGGYMPVVSPALFTRSFQTLGTRLDLAIKMPDAVGPSGYRGAVQAYCTSPNVTNRFLGQQELAGLALGSLQTLSFPLTQQDLTACTGTSSAWRLEFAVNSDAQTVSRLGLGSIKFAGTPVSVNSPLPMCPAPDAAPTPQSPPMTLPPIAISPDILRDNIAFPTTWTVSNGDVIRELLAGR